MLENDSPKRFAFFIEYDGTDYSGWQRQKADLKTIQGEVENAAQSFFGVPLTIDGASRTDAGVHARAQLCALTIRHPINSEGFVKVLNRRLPATIAVRGARQVSLGFAPRFALDEKTYRYALYQDKFERPLIRRFATRTQFELDTVQMQDAAQYLIGDHDFTSFAASDHQSKTTTRTISKISVHSDTDNLTKIMVTGTAFLKQMVRNIVGSLIEVGRGKRQPSWMAEVLEQKSRQSAGPTAPPQGLTLWQCKVRWSPESEAEFYP